MDEEDVIIEETAGEEHLKNDFQQNNYDVETRRRHMSNPCEDSTTLFASASSSYNKPCLASNFLNRSHKDEEPFVVIQDVGEDDREVSTDSRVMYEATSQLERQVEHHNLVGHVGCHHHDHHFLLHLSSHPQMTMISPSNDSMHAWIHNPSAARQVEDTTCQLSYFVHHLHHQQKPEYETLVHAEQGICLNVEDEEELQDDLDEEDLTEEEDDTNSSSSSSAA